MRTTKSKINVRSSVSLVVCASLEFFQYLYGKLLPFPSYNKKNRSSLRIIIQAWINNVQKTSNLPIKGAKHVNKLLLTATNASPSRAPQTAPLPSILQSLSRQTTLSPSDTGLANLVNKDTKLLQKIKNVKILTRKHHKMFKKMSLLFAESN